MLSQHIDHASSDAQFYALCINRCNKPNKDNMHKDDFYTFDGRCAISWLDRQTVEAATRRAIPGTSPDLPICLQHGTPRWGCQHILSKRGVALHRSVLRGRPVPRDVLVPTVVWKKLRESSGHIHVNEDEGKLSLFLTMGGNALAVLRAKSRPDNGDFFLSITTFYMIQHGVDGQRIGRYVAPCAAAATRLSSREPVIATCNLADAILCDARTTA